MKCLCEKDFTCSVCQEKIKDQTFDKAAAYVASLEGDDLIDFIKEVYMNSPNIEKIAEIIVAAEIVMEGLEDIREDFK